LPSLINHPHYCNHIKDNNHERHHIQQVSVLSTKTKQRCPTTLQPQRALRHIVFIIRHCWLQEQSIFGHRLKYPSTRKHNTVHTTKCRYHHQQCHHCSTCLPKQFFRCRHSHPIICRKSHFIPTQSGKIHVVAHEIQ